MVGYKREDSMTSNQKLIAGCISGVFTRFMTQPLDVIKIRTQLQRKIRKRQHKSVYLTSKKILLEEGITAFWHGHNLGQVHSILSTSSQFYVYEVLTKYAFDSAIDPKYKNVLEFMCGLCAGASSATLATPIEVIRVRQMLVKEQYRGIYNGAMVVYKNGGIFAFYEGWSAGVLMLGPQVAITFSIFGFVQPIILDYLRETTSNARSSADKPEHLLLASTFAALSAGFISKVMMYPFDLAKRRLQIAGGGIYYTLLSSLIVVPQLILDPVTMKFEWSAWLEISMSHRNENKYYTPTTSRNLVKCTNLIQCIRDTVKAEGFFGLYRGLKVTVYKALVTNIFTFTTYELTCYFIREFTNR